jgi:hypothetical protein
MSFIYRHLFFTPAGTREITEFHPSQGGNSYGFLSRNLLEDNTQEE